LTPARRNLQASGSICNRHDGCIAADVAIRQIPKVGSISTPMVSTCSCAWFSFKWSAHHLKLIREKCSEALHILDRFHIVANMNKALDKIRAEETSRMKREGRDPVLKKSRRLRST